MFWCACYDPRRSYYGTMAYVISITLITIHIKLLKNKCVLFTYEKQNQTLQTAVSAINRWHKNSDSCGWFRTKLFIRLDNCVPSSSRKPAINSQDNDFECQALYSLRNIKHDDSNFYDYHSNTFKIKLSLWAT